MLCPQELSIKLNLQTTLDVKGENVWLNGVQQPAVTSTAPLKATDKSWRIELRGDYYYLHYGTFGVKWDTEGTWFITLREHQTTPGYHNDNVRGLCGNFDGNALGELVIYSTWDIFLSVAFEDVLGRFRILSSIYKCVVNLDTSLS